MPHGLYHFSAIHMVCDFFSFFLLLFAKLMIVSLWCWCVRTQSSSLLSLFSLLLAFAFFWPLKFFFIILFIFYRLFFFATASFFLFWRYLPDFYGMACKRDFEYVYKRTYIQQLSFSMQRRREENERELYSVIWMINKAENAFC